MLDITKQFPGVLALDKAKLRVKKGTVHALMGENGAGKSTTIRMILGMTKPDSGEITIFGRKLTRELKEQIGVVLDEPGYPGCMTAAQISNMLSVFSKNGSRRPLRDICLNCIFLTISPSRISPRA